MKTEQHVIASACGEYVRDVWFVRGSTNAIHRLAIFLDAEHYVRDMNCIPILKELQESGAIPPISCLFVSHLSREARHQDLTCNARYSRFIAEDVVEWATERCRSIRSEDNLICGVSLSGLEGTFTALLYPEVFSYSLSQSGSFWWLAGKELPLPPTTARMWLSVGDAETATEVSHPPTGLFQQISQIEGVENAVEAFESLGATVRYHLFAGGHDFEPWKKELAPALMWLIGG